MMDKAQLAPFGTIERYQKPRRLGKKEPHARSTIITRWDIIFPAISDTISKVPQLQHRLQEIVTQRDKEVPITRAEFDQVAILLDHLVETWASFIRESNAAIKPKLETWHSNSRRGLFRLLVLLAILVIEQREVISGRNLASKGLGGKIKSEIRQFSNQALDAKAGSLYIALNDFKSDGFISNYNREANEPVKVTQRGKAFVLRAIDALRQYLDLLKRSGYFEALKQEYLAGCVPITDALLGMKTPPINLGEIMQAVSHLPATEIEIEKSRTFEDARDLDVKVAIDAWQDNLNRGAIDIYILSSLLAKPSYGNALIADAESALGIPTGTLYPKLRDLHERALIFPIHDIEKLATLNKAVQKNQGPEKVFYDVTARGVLYLLVITSLYLADLNVFLKFSQNLVKIVAEPVHSPAVK